MTASRTYFTQLYVMPLNRKALADTALNNQEQMSCPKSSVHLTLKQCLVPLKLKRSKPVPYQMLRKCEIKIS